MATAEPTVGSSTPAASSPVKLPTLYLEGVIAGIVGAATIAIWFLIMDTVNGRPLYTPTVLATALFKNGQGPASPETKTTWQEERLEALAGGEEPASTESPKTDFVTLGLFTIIHGLSFIIIGVIISRLLAVAELHQYIGLAILVLFVVLEFGFLATNMAFIDREQRALAWQSVLIGNLLAAAAMIGYFQRRHPSLRRS